MKRLEYADDDGTFARLLGTLADYHRAARAEDWAAATQAAWAAEELTTHLTDEALDRYDAAHPRRRRALAADLGRAHGTVNHRIARHRQRRTEGEQQ